MTLSELFNILNSLDKDIPVAYFCFKKAQNLPYICYLVTDNDGNFMADNKVYKKISSINIELYTEDKDIDLEERLEALLDEHKLCYTSNEAYIESEGVFQKIYTIGVI